MRTISEVLHENAAQWPAREALVVTRRGCDEKLTFAELEVAANQFASHLVSRGVRPGDAVLVFVPMSLKLYIALLGLFRIGATAVFLDPSSGLSHINACCTRLPPAALISVWPLRWLRPFVPGLRQIPQVFSPPCFSALSNALGHLPQPPASDAPALITFTSGSTGIPKAAVRSHQFLIAQHRALEKSISLKSGERDLTTLPVFVLANLASGITSILPDARISHPGSVNEERIEDQVMRLRPTRTGGSPALYQRLLNRPAALASFRKIYTGGAPVFPVFLQRLQQAAPSAEVIAVYGSTEAEPIAHVACSEISLEDWEAMRTGKGLLTGAPIPEIRLRIIDDQWGQPIRQLQSLPSGQMGEILVTGDHVLKGYLGGQGNEETKIAIEGEVWHRTGDAGYLDDRGRLWLMGRCSARVHDEKGTLYPFAVECVAMSFPQVKRAAFVQIQGKRLLALEMETAGASEPSSELIASLSWAALDETRILRRIPVDARHNAKVNYPQLLRLLN